MRISDWSSDVGSSYLDINQAWDENTASVWIPRLEAAGVALVEQPVARSNFDALRRLSADNGVAILADASLSSLASAFELAPPHCLVALSPQMCHIGGVANTLQLPPVAERPGIPSSGGTKLAS